MAAHALDGATPAQEVESLLGAPLTVAAPERLAAYSLDGVTPDVAAIPETREQVGEVLALAHANGWGLVPWGGGHGMGAGGVPADYRIALCLSRLEKLVEHDPDNLTLVGEGGLTLADANLRTAKARQFLPLGWPGDRGTLGGIVAAARPAPKRLLYGDVRDLLIGITVALPDGSLVRYGRKVIKNVAGYDMNKLFLGSHGMLGVIVETIFKLSALPDEEGAVPGAFADFTAAADAARALAASAFTPAYLLLLDAGLAAALRSGGHLQAPEGGVLLLVGFEGRGLALRRQIEAALQFIGQHGGEPGQPTDAPGEAAAALLAAPPPPPLSSPLSLQHGGHTESHQSGQAPQALRLRIGATPAALAGLCGQVRESLAALGTEVTLLVDYGAGAVQAVLPWPEEAALAGLVSWIGELRGSLQEQRGYVAVQSAPASFKQAAGVWGDMSGEAEIMTRIKARLDPKGIMVPGRFLGKLF